MIAVSASPSKEVQVRMGEEAELVKKQDSDLGITVQGEGEQNSSSSESNLVEEAECLKKAKPYNPEAGENSSLHGKPCVILGEAVSAGDERPVSQQAVLPLCKDAPMREEVPAAVNSETYQTKVETFVHCGADTVITHDDGGSDDLLTAKPEIQKSTSVLEEQPESSDPWKRKIMLAPVSGPESSDGEPTAKRIQIPQSDLCSATASGTVNNDEHAATVTDEHNYEFVKARETEEIAEERERNRSLHHLIRK